MAGDIFIIRGSAGKKTLSGTTRVNGSKNDAVQALAATLLFKNGLDIDNLPQIEDIGKMRSLLEELGVTVSIKGGRRFNFATTKISSSRLDPAIAKSIRASILLTGPLLARTGEVNFPHPGGCVIGARPIDLFLSGFAKMGAQIKETEEGYVIKTPKTGLRAAEIFFKNQSVTVTETFILTGILARGKTILKNCAVEPEIENLGRFLNSCGAKIRGLGSPTLEITGGKLLDGEGKVYRVLPDRIEAGSLLILGALVGKKVTITGSEPKHLESLLTHLELMGVKTTVKGKNITVTAPTSIRPINLVTHEYPGFPTDLQSPMAVLLTQARGESTIFETIFEGRLSYLETLATMGAEAKILNPHQAVIKGQTKLKGRSVESPDLRAGLAYILAGAIARGESVVHNVNYIDRGYERIDKRLKKLGLDIKRING